MIEADLKRERITVRFPWTPDRVAFDGMVASLKAAVPSARWNKMDRVWTMPAEMAVARTLRKIFGQQLVIKPALWEWAKQQNEREKELKPLLSAKDAELELVPSEAPHIWKAMESRKYQRAVVAYGAKARRVLNASEVGLGKTLESLATLVESDCHGLHIVIAKKTALRTVWADQIEQWLGWPTFVVSGDRKRRDATLESALSAYRSGNHADVVVVINAQMLNAKKVVECHEKGCEFNGGLYDHADSHQSESWWEYGYPQLFQNVEWSSVIFDETHEFLLNTNLYTKRVTQVGAGAVMLPLRSYHIKMALSGTPYKGKPEKIWGTLHWLHPERFTSYWAWIGMYFHVSENEWGGKVIGGIKDPIEFGRMLDSVMIRHNKREVRPELPPIQYAGTHLDPKDESSPVRVWLEMDPKQASLYRKMAKHSEVELESGKLSANGVLAEMTRLRQFAVSCGDMINGKFTPTLPSSKFDWLWEFCDDLGIVDGTGDGKVVVASQFTSVINLFVSEFKRKGIEVFCLTGETSDKLRADQVRRFAEPGGPRVFFINTKAGGASITLDAADNLVILDETFVPDDQEQVEGRADSRNVIHQLTVWRLATRSTLDETILRIADERDDIQKKLLDARRGVTFAKQLLSGSGK